ncbi:MAG: hypothetical protein QXI27_02760 [Nitrososphaerota archaeon]
MEEATIKRIEKIFEEAEKILSSKATMMKDELRRICEKIINECADHK